MQKNKLLSRSTWNSQVIALLMLSSVFFTACEEEDIQRENPSASSIHHVTFTESKKVYYNHPIVLDLNQDGKDDYLFTVGLFMNGESVDQKFVAVSLENAQIRIMEEKAVAYPDAYTIGDVHATDPAIWSVDSGVLMTVTKNEHKPTVYLGPWIINPEGYLAVCIRLNNSNHFGWVKLKSETQSENMLITEYAINMTPGKTIDTGQTK